VQVSLSATILFLQFVAGFKKILCKTITRIKLPVDVAKQILFQ